MQIDMTDKREINETKKSIFLKNNFDSLNSDFAFFKIYIYNYILFM